MVNLKNWGLDSRHYAFRDKCKAVVWALVFFLLGIILLAGIDGLRWLQWMHQQTMISYNPHTLLACIFLGLVFLGLATSSIHRAEKQAGNSILVAINTASLFALLFGNILEFALQMRLAQIYLWQQDLPFSNYAQGLWKIMWPQYAVSLLGILSCSLVRFRLRSHQFDVQRSVSDTSGNLGSARLATEQDLVAHGLRNDSGALLGKDDRGYLRYPHLTDRLILAFRGSGKTSSLLVPLIIDYMNVNKLITDIKGELAAITAKKAIDRGREVYILDPFLVTKGLGLSIATHHINPLAGVESYDALTQDRYITAIAAALGSSDRGARTETESHFQENAQIILEGIIEYYIHYFKNSPEKMNLVALHDWWLECVTDTESSVIEQMKKGSCKAMAAAAQLSSAGKDESGSMRTTVYRQLQWLRSSHIREVFSGSGINIDDFVSGKCDIYIVLPEDMIKAYARMVRVVMALVKIKLIQAKPECLHKDYCFILDECGQFGYCPDIENIINTMRYRGVKVWASFQTLSQVDVYQDEEVFKGMPIKHFLGSDDIKTMRWIQELGSKTTVLTENVSRNTSSALKNAKSSVSESYSVSETAADLIQFHDIREMASDEQFIFIKGMQPIRCRKAYYFREPIYRGKFDVNPAERV